MPKKSTAGPFGGLDPNPNENLKPKGKMTSYAFFVQICREEHKKKYPDEYVGFQEFSKKCAERWRYMSEKEKIQFNKMAEHDKKRYEVEMANYSVAHQNNQNTTNNSGKQQKGRNKKKKDPNAPKRSMSAFFWFSQDERKKVRAENPNFGVGEVAKELGRRWGEVDPAVKSKFEALAEKDRARYTKEKKAYQLSQKADGKKASATNVADKGAFEENDEAEEESDSN